MMYEMEELVPIVAELSHKFTSGDSTSVTYDKAEQFMEAVIYCIEEIAKSEGSVPARTERLSAKEAYDLGSRLTMEKTKETLDHYQELIIDFEDYGNANLRDTVMKGIAGFFKYYDIQYEPQNTIITMDYPLLVRSVDLSGIDAISEYVEALMTEQAVLRLVPYDYAVHVLRKSASAYETQMFNISTIIVRHLVAVSLLRILIPEPESDYRLSANESAKWQEALYNYVGDSEVEELRNVLSEILGKIMYAGLEATQAEAAVKYFSVDMKDFAYELKNVTECRYLKNVVVI